MIDIVGAAVLSTDVVAMLSIPFVVLVIDDKLLALLARESEVTVCKDTDSAPVESGLVSKFVKTSENVEEGA